MINILKYCSDCKISCIQNMLSLLCWYNFCIWQDASKTRGAYPVIVLIHGAAFTKKNDKYNGPDFLITEGVILVTMNYRIGACGQYTGTPILIFFFIFLRVCRQPNAWKDFYETFMRQHTHFWAQNLGWIPRVC